jgi:hypothetical protein
VGNYGLAYSSLKLWKYPYLPHFDLLKMHPLEVDIGVPWTAYFFDQCEGWQKPERIEYSIDKFIAATIAYGHIGWLVEESHGVHRMCRSYYMLQQLQSRYVMRPPEEILYGTDTGLVSSSKALLDGAWRDSRLFVRYPGALRIWVNGNDEKNWCVDLDATRVTLPPSGWVAVQGKEFSEQSALVDGYRVDHVSSPAYVYVDGRGKETECDGIGTSGAVAVRPCSADGGLSLIAIEGVECLRISQPTGRYKRDDVRHCIGTVARAKSLNVEAFDVEGNSLGSVPSERDRDEWIIRGVPEAIRYEIRAAAGGK